MSRPLDFRTPGSLTLVGITSGHASEVPTKLKLTRYQEIDWLANRTIYSRDR